eukprot:scaffold82211_cov29-Attheya_sp.AAC.1
MGQNDYPHPHASALESTEPMLQCQTPIFSSYRDVSGATCGQVFFGMSSKVFNIYGMRGKGEFPETYLDFIRYEGAPRVLRRDNAKEENSEEVKNINRKYIIAQSISPLSPINRRYTTQVVGNNSSNA